MLFRSPTGSGSVAFRAPEGRAFADVQAEVQALLDADGGPKVEVEIDQYGYTWIVVRTDPPDLSSLVTDLHAVTLAAPLLMLAVACLGPREPDTPMLERMVSMGAAIQNLLLGAHALGFGAGLTVLRSGILRAGASPNEKLNVAVIGCGGRGQTNLDGTFTVGTQQTVIAFGHDLSLHADGAFRGI